MRARPASLRAFITDECANYVGGRCIDGGGVCRVIHEKKRCGYFEQCVLPIATRGLRQRCSLSPRDDSLAATQYRRIRQ